MECHDQVVEIEEPQCYIQVQIEIFYLSLICIEHIHGQNVKYHGKGDQEIANSRQRRYENDDGLLEEKHRFEKKVAT